MQKLIECVPNFSEGRNQATLDAISTAVRNTPGVQLLDVDPGQDTNRTVFTFVGAPQAVAEAAFQAIKVGSQLIDMRQHHGEHPRMGACDVCPFIPLQNVDVAECVQLAEKVAERVANELQIPVYLYEYAARNAERKNLATIRAGEYEGLDRKMQDPAWKPDFGAAFNAKSGATVMGVREFLIAYNVNLNTSDKKLAHDIALSIRETGRLKRDEDGNILKDADGNQMKQPGLHVHVKAVGWYIEQYRQAQVSINLTHFKVTPPHLIYDTIRAEAEKRGLLVTGSELVGLIPLEAMLMAGRHYLRKQGKSCGVPEEELVETAIRSLGLDQLGPFDANQKVIEYRFRPLAGPLAALSLRQFNNVLSTDSPAPGGGSAAALAGAVGASLAGMVGNLTANGMSAVQKRQEPARFELLATLAEQAQTLKDRYLQDIDRDTEAFNQLMAAMRTKAASDDEKKTKQAAVQEATRGAIAVPFNILKHSVDIMKLARTAAERGNPASASDAGVAAAMAWSAALGGYYNVLINLKGIEDAAYCERTRAEAAECLRQARELAAELEAVMASMLAPVPETAAAP